MSEFLTGDEAKRALSSISGSEHFKIEVPAVGIAEMNLELAKKLGRTEEAEAFQYILDHGLAEEFSYASKHSKKFLRASEYVARVSAEGHR